MKKSKPEKQTMPEDLEWLDTPTEASVKRLIWEGLITKIGCWRWVRAKAQPLTDVRRAIMQELHVYEEDRWKRVLASRDGFLGG